MTDIMDDFDDVAGMERMSYGKFSTTYTVRRAAQAPSKFEDWGQMQLPIGSVLHTLNGFDTLVGNGTGLPDPNLPVVVNEKSQIFLKIHNQMAAESSVPFGVKETFTYRPNVLTPLLTHFYQTHKRYHRIIADRMIGNMAGVLTWIDYSPLNEARVTGQLHAYRKFDIMFRTILDRIVAIGDGVHHFIHLPQGSEVFSRMSLQRTFKELSNSTLNPLSHDPSIFPIIHLMGYVFGRTKDQDVVPYKEDIKLLGKDAPLFGEVHSTSLLERLPTNLLNSINVILQKDQQVVVYNLGELTRLAENNGFFGKFYRHCMNLRLNGMEVPEQLDRDSDQFDDYVDNISSETQTARDPKDAGIPLSMLKEAAKRATGASEVVKPVTVTSPADLAAEQEFERETHPDNFEGRLRTKVIEHHASTISVEPKKESKRDQLMDNHLNASMGGKTLAELIQAPPSQSITPKKMDFLTSTPEESYQRSSLLAMDEAYLTHGYPHEMAKVVASLAKHGMFINKVEESKVHTEMDRTSTYKVHLTDINGKSHHIKYTVPDIDKNGNMKLSGVEYRLTRQIANVPICKTSPTRVNLSSYYNKIIVERIKSKRYSFEQSIGKFITQLKNDGLLQAVMGAAPLPTKPVAYDYTAIGRQFTEVTVGEYHFHFGGDGAPMDGFSEKEQDRLVFAESLHGIYVGRGPNGSYLFWDLANKIHLWKNDHVEQSWGSFLQFLANQLGKEGTIDSTPIEWTQANIINQTIPLIYILAMRFGLKRVLQMIRLDYRFYTNKREAHIGVDDLTVAFADGILVFNRYPLSRSLIAAGLLWTDLRKFTFESMTVTDTYVQVFAQKKMSVGVLKGIRGFYDFFVDPITETILEKMNEPITFHELLLRANVMLTDYNAKPSSSVELHRFRLYERFNGIVYNEIMRGLQTHRNNPSTKKSFSINPEAVFQKIVQDATVTINEVINPVHEVKQRTNFSFTGSGGRNGNSFVLKDRIYPPDGLGVISDAVPDSGKVGITAYLSASPNIDDLHGIPKAYTPGDQLEPPQILSIGSMVMPGGTTDDGKRNSYLSIQLSHYVPNHEEGETLSVRTGYDEVLPHLTSSTFAVSAPDNGVVEAIDEKQKVMRVRYADHPAQALRKIKVPYLDGVLDGMQRGQASFGYLIPESEISHYPMGGVFELTKNTYGKIVDRLRCDTPEAIPDKDIARKQSLLVQDFIKGRHQALYFIRFVAVSNKVPGEVKSYSYADIYSQNSGAYLLQKIKPNVKVGDTFKTGDILLYNSGFFTPDPFSKQVTFKHGITATVALVEKSSNHEDACEISQDFSRRLKMTPCHQREVVTRANAAILAMVKVGDHVETSDSLCVISDEYLIGSSLDVNSDNLDIFEKLNRQTPQAGYTGTIQKVRVLYGGEREKLSDSIKAVLKVYEKEVRDNFKALNDDPQAKPPEKPGWVAPGTKYQGLDFTTDTVVIEFMIDETLDMAEGDKLCVSNSAKSIVSHVNEKTHYTESGIAVDMLFSTTSIVNRIVMSPFSVGLAETVMEALKKQSIEKYFS